MEEVQIIQRKTKRKQTFKSKRICLNYSSWAKAARSTIVIKGRKN